VKEEFNIWRTKKSRKLNQLPNRTDGANITKILMPNNRLSDAFSLLLGCTIVLQLAESKVTTIKLER
jgi:hypothetical protein